MSSAGFTKTSVESIIVSTKKQKLSVAKKEGVATTRLPDRLSVRANLTLITLHSAQNAQITTQLLLTALSVILIGTMKKDVHVA